jgi:hypothetical protein
MERFSRRVRFNSGCFLRLPWDTGDTPPELVEQAEIDWLAKALTLARREDRGDLVVV